MEGKLSGSLVKVKKYETILVQIWQLLPFFCSSNSPNLSDCFAQLLKYLEPILNKDVLGLRLTALKTFSALIRHCKVTKVVDEEIKKTRKGLQNIALDYIQGLVTLYTEDEDIKVQKERHNNILVTLGDFASIAKTGKLSNLFLQSFAEVV
jgi:hypothetical protein